MIPNSTTARLGLFALSSILLVAVLGSLSWAIAAVLPGSPPVEPLLDFLGSAVTALAAAGGLGSVAYGARHVLTAAPTSAMVAGGTGKPRNRPAADLGDPVPEIGPLAEVD